MYIELCISGSVAGSRQQSPGSVTQLSVNAKNRRTTAVVDSVVLVDAEGGEGERSIVLRHVLTELLRLCICADQELLQWSRWFLEYVKNNFAVIAARTEFRSPVF
jgi:hypothetical protein